MVSIYMGYIDDNTNGIYNILCDVCAKFSLDVYLLSGDSRNSR